MATDSSSRDLKRAIRAGMIGSVLEWYDFAVYGFLAPVLGRLFFPPEDAFVSLLAAFAVFAVGYAARPLGGVLFGHIGDRLGRRTALILSIVAMGVATTAIGLLPDYSQIGPLAALLLVILRIAQGLSVGGEYTGAIIFLAEHAPAERRGFYASLPQFATLIGFLLGSGIGALVSSVLGEAALLDWGWRLPFLLGGALAVFGLVLRRHLGESPAMAAQEERPSAPLLVALRDHRGAMLRIVGLVLVGGVGFYTVFVYGAAALESERHISLGEALAISSFNLIVMLAVTLPCASLGDRVGRKPVLLGATLGLLLLAWPLWSLMQRESLWWVTAGQAGFAVLLGAFFAALPGTLVELLPGRVRSSGVSVSYNVSLGLFGGSAPVVATYLVGRSGDDWAPVVYLLAAALVSTACIFSISETARRPLA